MMKLRWVEREVKISAGYDLHYEKEVFDLAKVKVLQYWDSVDGSPVYGRWVDVPLEVE
jgi:hypothetical protein